MNPHIYPSTITLSGKETENNTNNNPNWNGYEIFSSKGTDLEVKKTKFTQSLFNTITYQDSTKWNTQQVEEWIKGGASVEVTGLHGLELWQTAILRGYERVDIIPLLASSLKDNNPQKVEKIITCWEKFKSEKPTRITILLENIVTDILKETVKVGLDYFNQLIFTINKLNKFLYEAINNYDLTEWNKKNITQYIKEGANVEVIGPNGLELWQTALVKAYGPDIIKHLTYTIKNKQPKNSVMGYERLDIIMLLADSLKGKDEQKAEKIENCWKSFKNTITDTIKFTIELENIVTENEKLVHPDKNYITQLISAIGAICLPNQRIKLFKQSNPKYSEIKKLFEAEPDQGGNNHWHLLAANQTAFKDSITFLEKLILENDIINERLTAPNGNNETPLNIAIKNLNYPFLFFVIHSEITSETNENLIDWNDPKYDNILLDLTKIAIDQTDRFNQIGELKLKRSNIQKILDQIPTESPSDQLASLKINKYLLDFEFLNNKIEELVEGIHRRIFEFISTANELIQCRPSLLNPNGQSIFQTIDKWLHDKNRTSYFWETIKQNQKLGLTQTENDLLMKREEMKINQSIRREFIETQGKKLLDRLESLKIKSELNETDKLNEIGELKKPVQEQKSGNKTSPTSPKECMIC